MEQIVLLSFQFMRWSQWKHRVNSGYIQEPELYPIQNLPDILDKVMYRSQPKG